MKKIPLLLCLLLVMWWLCIPHPVIAKPKEKLFYTLYPDVPVYVEPLKTSKIISYISYGTPLRLKGKQKDNWYKVTDSKTKKEGWVKGHNLSPLPIRLHQFSNPEHRYSINYPEGWLLKGLNADWVYAKAPKMIEEPVAITIQVGYTATTDLEIMMQEHELSISYQKQQHESALFIRSTTNTKINQQSAKKIHFFVHQKDKTLEAYQYLMIYNGRVYSIITAAPIQEYKSFNDHFQKTLLSFKLL